MGRRPYAIWKKRCVNLASLLATGLNRGFGKSAIAVAPESCGGARRLQPRGVTVSTFLQEGACRLHRPQCS
jgi:hypothetical protein